MANVVHTNQKSKNIIDEIHTKIFMHLFEILADKTSNIIDGKQIDLSEIPETIQIIIMPLLDELKEQNETLTLEQFIAASKYLYVTLPIQHKQNLMDWYLSYNKIKRSIHTNNNNIQNFAFKVFAIFLQIFLFISSLISYKHSLIFIIDYIIQPQLCEKSREIADKSNLLCTNMYLKSIESIKLVTESIEKTQELENIKKNLNFYSNKSKTDNSQNNSQRYDINTSKNKHTNKTPIYNDHEKIRETLEENNTEVY